MIVIAVLTVGVTAEVVVIVLWIIVTGTLQMK